MTTIEKIKRKTIHISIDELIKRLKVEFNIKNNENIDVEKANSFLEYSIYDTLLIILDITNLDVINEKLYSIWLSMIKDYWYLNKYDKLIKKPSKTDEIDENEDMDNLDVSSIKEGDTQVNFSSNTNMININGTRYTTGSINFDENILREKYKDDLYRHRRLRWGI